ncbi:MAG: ABC transporter permease, partial [Spirochaetaceae bacterium]
MFITIAWRNLLRNKKRSLVFAISIFVTCFFFLAGKALGNASSIQSLSRFKNFQSGDIAIAWESIDKLAEDDPGRLLLSEIDISLDNENKRAMDKITAFLARHKDEVKEFFAPVRASGTFDSGSMASYAFAWGVTKEELEFFFRTGVLVLREGAPLHDYDHAAYISEETARESNLDIGDWFTFDAPTVYGPVNSVTFQVAGIYAAGAPWDNLYFYTPIEYVRELLAVQPPYWSSMRIYLNNASSAHDFASEFSALQTGNNLVIRIQTFRKASAFWRTFGSMQKDIIMYFSVFLLLIIGLGIRSSVRMNVYQRMSEAGTLAAMGFGKAAIFMVIAYEIIILSFIALITAVAAALIFVLVAGYYGVYVGGFGFEYITGSQYLYPSLEPEDLVLSTTAIMIFSLFAPLKPTLRILMLRIPDLLAKNAKTVFVSFELLRKYIFRKDILKKNKGSKEH